MNKYYFALSFLMVALLIIISPQSVLAHGHSEFKIGNKIYQFVVGSLNEPIAVDDKTGVDLRISEVVGSHDEDEHHEDEGVITKPAAGLETTLKVELIAGDKNKILDLSPVYNTPGSYKANFIPTVQTTYTYRVFGKINGVEVSLPFTCNPAGHPQTEEETEPIQISPGVTQLEKAGAFGCPVAKADLGFPEQSVSIVDIKNEAGNTAGALAEVRAAASSSRTLGVTGVILGLLGLAVGAWALMKSKSV